MRHNRILVASPEYGHSELRHRRWRHRQSSEIFSASMLVMCLSFQAPSLAAGHCYKAESLKGPNGEHTSKPIEPVCLAMERNLNEFCEQPPMVCDLKIHPKHARELALPKWEPVDLGGNFSLVEELIRTPYRSAPDPNAADHVWEGERPGIEAAFKEGRLKVSTAQLDLYQTGTKAKTYRYDLGDCTQKNSYLKLRNDNGNWEVELKTPEVRVNLAPNDYRTMETRYRSLSGAGLGGEVFFFRGQTFSYHMLGFRRKGENPDLPSTNEARVNQGVHFLLNGKPTIDYRNVCELNYQPARHTK